MSFWRINIGQLKTSIFIFRSDWKSMKKKIVYLNFSSNRIKKLEITWLDIILNVKFLEIKRFYQNVVP